MLSEPQIQNEVFIGWFERYGTKLKTQTSVFVVLSTSRLPGAVRNNKLENYDSERKLLLR